MKHTIRECRLHRIINNNVNNDDDHNDGKRNDSILRSTISPKHANGSTKHTKNRKEEALDTNHWIQYLAAILILSAFVFLLELSSSSQSSSSPSQSHVNIVLRSLDHFLAGSGGTTKQKQLQRPFTVDILSVASISQLPLLRAQKQALSSHISVRNFFNVTELDDADPHCHTNITWEHVAATSNRCRSRRGKKLNDVTRYMTGQYARIEWLMKKKNPMGWLCAQPRPYAGLRKAYRHYQDTGEALPDYFIIMDDDTYYNMELFQEHFEEKLGNNSSSTSRKKEKKEETFTAGCLVRPPVHQINFTFPFGGFGSILSEGAMENLFRRIDCPGWSDENRAGENSPLCDRLKEDTVWELRHFENGMNLVEIMYKYTTAEKYGDVSKWKTGFCMHSDWVIGYFVNHYNVSKHVVNPYYKDVPHARIESHKESEIYRNPSGFCKNDRVCKAGTEICHRVTPKFLREETERLRLNAPDKFRRDAKDG